MAGFGQNLTRIMSFHAHHRTLILIMAFFRQENWDLEKLSVLPTQSTQLMSRGDKCEPILQLLTTSPSWVSTMQVHLKHVVPRGQGNDSEIHHVPFLKRALHMLFPLPKCSSFPPSLSPTKLLLVRNSVKEGLICFLLMPLFTAPRAASSPS